MSLRPPETVRKLQATLHAKAKEAPGYRFYSLHDKVYREDVPAHAYRLSRRNGGSAGVDGQSFEEIESSGLEAWLGALAQYLKEKTYQPEAVLVLGPIFEADLPPELHAYRAGVSAHDAVRRAGSSPVSCRGGKAGAARKALRSHRSWRTCTCGGWSWAGRSWATQSASARRSSTMPMT